MTSSLSQIVGSKIIAGSIHKTFFLDNGDFIVRQVDPRDLQTVQFIPISVTQDTTRSDDPRPQNVDKVEKQSRKKVETFTKTFPKYYENDSRQQEIIVDGLLRQCSQHFPSVKISRAVTASSEYSTVLEFKGDTEDNMSRARSFLEQKVTRLIDNHNAKTLLKSGDKCIEVDIKLDVSFQQRGKLGIENNFTDTKNGLWVRKFEDKGQLPSVLGKSIQCALITHVKCCSDSTFEAVISKDFWNKALMKARSTWKRTLNDSDKWVIARVCLLDTDAESIDMDFVQSDSSGRHSIKYRNGTLYRDPASSTLNSPIAKRGLSNNAPVIQPKKAKLDEIISIFK